jgi:hypothetical protein
LCFPHFSRVRSSNALAQLPTSPSPTLPRLLLTVRAAQWLKQPTSCTFELTTRFSLFSPLFTYKERFAGFPFTGRLRPGVVSPMRTVPSHIPKPDYAETGIHHTLATNATVENHSLLRAILKTFSTPWYRRA